MASLFIRWFKLIHNFISKSPIIFCLFSISEWKFLAIFKPIYGKLKFKIFFQNKRRQCFEEIQLFFGIPQLPHIKLAIFCFLRFIYMATKSFFIKQKHRVISTIQTNTQSMRSALAKSHKYPSFSIKMACKISIIWDWHIHNVPIYFNYVKKGGRQLLLALKDEVSLPEFL